jgi:hypothetical protein
VFAPNRHSLVSEITHVLLQRKQSMLEAGTYSASFPFKNSPTSLMQYFLQIRIFNVEIVSVRFNAYSYEL